MEHKSQDGPIFKNAAKSEASSGNRAKICEDPVSNLGTYIINMCRFLLLKGFDFQEMFGQIVAVTPSFDQLILLPKFILAWPSGC